MITQPEWPRSMGIPTVRWQGELTAMSSISHGAQTRGVTTLLRREQIRHPDGHLVQVPIVSGNSLRGRLRRTGEELMRAELGYDGELTPAAAHLLRGGGSLAKTTGESLSGARLARVRALVPQIALFGAAAAGTIVSGAVDVGKVMPFVAETNHLTGGRETTPAFSATQMEEYSRHDDATSHDFVAAEASEGSPRMRFSVETFPAGTRFSCWVRLRWPTVVEWSLLSEILDVFSVEGRLGGRVAIGHGQVHATWRANPAPAEDITHRPWRQWVSTHRDEIIEVLNGLG